MLCQLELFSVAFKVTCFSEKFSKMQKHLLGKIMWSQDDIQIPDGKVEISVVFFGLLNLLVTQGGKSKKILVGLEWVLQSSIQLLILYLGHGIIKVPWYNQANCLLKFLESFYTPHLFFFPSFPESSSSQLKLDRNDLSGWNYLSSDNFIILNISAVERYLGTIDGLIFIDRPKDAM